MTRMTSLSESLLSGNPTPQQNPRNVRSLVESASRSRSGLSLSESQVAELGRLLEAMRDDPFQSGKSVMTTDELDSLGVQFSEERQLGITDQGTDPLLNDDGDEDRHQPYTRERSQPILSIQESLVAPNATPGHKSIIPEKVVIAMMAISPDSFSEVQPGTGQARIEPSLSREPVRRPIQQPDPTRQPQQPGRMVESVDTAAILAEVRAKRKQSPLNQRRTKGPISASAPDSYKSKLANLG